MTKPTFTERVRRLANWINEDEPETPEELDARIRAMGYDPEQLAADMRARIAAMTTTPPADSARSEDE